MEPRAYQFWKNGKNIMLENNQTWKPPEATEDTHLKNLIHSIV